MASPILPDIVAAVVFGKHILPATIAAVVLGSRDRIAIHRKSHLWTPHSDPPASQEPFLVFTSLSGSVRESILGLAFLFDSIAGAVTEIEILSNRFATTLLGVRDPIWLHFNNRFSLAILLPIVTGANSGLREPTGQHRDHAFCQSRSTSTPPRESILALTYSRIATRESILACVNLLDTIAGAILGNREPTGQHRDAISGCGHVLDSCKRANPGTIRGRAAPGQPSMHASLLSRPFLG